MGIGKRSGLGSGFGGLVQLRKFAKAIRELAGQTLSAGLLRDRFLVGEEGELQVCYAPFDWVNDKAELIILGITPGLQQAQAAFAATAQALADGASVETAAQRAKVHASFAGPMRHNICQMLDALGLPARLGVSGTECLWNGDSHLLHSTSVIRYPAFYADENYTGHRPPLLRSPLLCSFVQDVLAAELQAVPRALIVPCGNAVSESLDWLVSIGSLDPARILRGFPHPSGGNGHRKRQFELQKASMSKTISHWFGGGKCIQNQHGPAPSRLDPKRKQIMATPQRESTPAAPDHELVSADGLCRSFYIETDRGYEVYPYRVRNQRTGRSAFVVSNGGNTREDAVEVDSEAELLQYVNGMGYRTRCKARDGDRKGLYSGRSPNRVRRLD